MVLTLEQLKNTQLENIVITATFTNDRINPIHLQLAISEEYDFPDSCGDKKYNVFSLPKELTLDIPTLYNHITDGVDNDRLGSKSELPYDHRGSYSPSR